MLAVLGAYVSLWTLYGVVAKSQPGHQLRFCRGRRMVPRIFTWLCEASTLGRLVGAVLVFAVSRNRLGLLPAGNDVHRRRAMVRWQVFKRYCSAEKSVLAFAFLTFVPFYNFHALKFDHNTILLPLWAATTFWFLRSFETGKTAWAALAGAGAATAMLAKYWSIYLVVGLALAATLDARRGLYFRSAAPWITRGRRCAVIGATRRLADRSRFQSNGLCARCPRAFIASRHSDQHRGLPRRRGRICRGTDVPRLDRKPTRR